MFQKLFRKCLFFVLALAFFVPAIALCQSQPALSVVNISTDEKPGYAIYWPKDAGNVRLERATAEGAFSVIAETDLNFYADFDVTKGTTYTYRVNVGGQLLTAISTEDVGGRPQISGINIESGSVGKDEASVIVNFVTDRLAQNQVFYGETADYGSKTEIDESLNQNHTVLIEGLKPNKTYHFKIRAVDKTGAEVSESENQTFTTPPVPKEQTILEIIIEALTKAFSGFAQWLRG